MPLLQIIINYSLISLQCITINNLGYELSMQSTRFFKAGCIGLDWHGTVRRGKTKWKQMEASALHRRRPSDMYRNSSGIVDRAKRSEGPKRAEGK
jgi:hypothetical protein